MDAQVVVATGGYVAGPAIIAGWLTRRPVVLCEQNSFPGLTSRAGSLFARKVCLGLPGAKGHLWRKSKATLTGNPVAIKPPAMTATEIKAKFGLKRELPMVLITGGSQGAASINRAVVEMIESSGLPSGVQLLWQTGAGKEDEIKAELSSCPERVSIVPFISPMSEAYVIANIVVARCGALTLSEIAAFGLPALLVPYPYATADHQRRNAEAFSEAGAAIVVQDSEISGDTFREVILELMSDEERRKQMAEASKKLGRPEALKEIVDIIENLAVSG